MEDKDAMKTAAPSETKLTKEYGKGFSMLKKMGFKTGTGLGPSGDGIVTPIEIQMRRPGEGLKDNEGAAPKPKRSKKTKGIRKPGSKEQSADGDIEMYEEYDSSASSGEESAVELSPEEQRILDARQLVEKLTDSRRRIQYQLFELDGNRVPDTNSNSLEGLVRDCELLEEAVGDAEYFKRLVDLLRDRYDSDPLWYALDAESLITSAVSELVSRSTEAAEISSSLIQSVHELVMDDDHFARILEYQLLPPLALNPDISLFQAIKQTASALHYQSIFYRFLRDFFVRSLEDPKRDPVWLIESGWFDLVPQGRARTDLLLNHVEPRLVTSSAPFDVLPWRPLFEADHWREILMRIAAQLQQSLRKMDPTSPAAIELLEVAVAWGEVVGPCVVGFLLVESKFLPKWFDIYNSSPQFPQMCCRILPLVARVAYHSPARRIVLDALRTARGEPVGAQAVRRRPGGPPPNFFTSSKPAAVLTQSQQGKLTIGDVLREEGIARNVLVAPKPGIREDGCQVLRVGDKTVYWKDDSIYEKRADGNWHEIHIESLFV